MPDPELDAPSRRRRGYGRMLGAAPASTSAYETDHGRYDLAPVNSPITAATTAPPLGLDRRRRRQGYHRRAISPAFLTLLTTQLKNQNPLDPLDTNQFTQQLVQFAQVEQQMKPNDQLATLVALQQTAQSTAALGFVGTTVAVDGADRRD